MLGPTSIQYSLNCTRKRILSPFEVWKVLDARCKVCERDFMPPQDDGTEAGIGRREATPEGGNSIFASIITVTRDMTWDNFEWHSFMVDCCAYSPYRAHSYMNCGSSPTYH